MTHNFLFGGDQLTVARIRGAQILRDTQDKPVDRFEGIIPVIEDWHTRTTLLKSKCFQTCVISCMYIRIYVMYIMQVIRKRLYNQRSTQD